MTDTSHIGYTPQETPFSANSSYNALRFLTEQMIARIGTSTLVEVVAVTNNGALAPVGYVDVLPLVNQTDGAGNAVPHAVLHNLPYVRIQGGTNAIIIDPQVGDIGVACFASRDISAVKNAKTQSNPGSGRRYDMSDGMYIGGTLNTMPLQTLQFNTAGITLTSPTEVLMTAPITSVNGLLMTSASSGAEAGIRLPPGASPSAPVNGDIWSTNLGFFGQVAGVTVPLNGTSGGGGGVTITLTGAVTGSGSGTISTTLSHTAVTAGSYTSANITVGADGRLTSAANGSGSGVSSVTGTAPIVSSGGTTPAISINVFGASGGSHSTGAVPDPGSSAGSLRALFETATWNEVMPVIGTQQSITPSTDPFFANVSLLFHFDEAPGSLIYIDSSNYNHTTNRNGAGGGIYTTQSATKKFGPCSFQSATNTTNRLDVVGIGTELQMGTGDFTAEMWINLTVNDGQSHALIGQGFNTPGGWALFIGGSNKLDFFAGGTTLITGTNTLALSTWHFVAVCRSGTTTKIFLNGNVEGSATDANNYTFAGFGVAGIVGTGVSFLGFMDEVRLTKGVARYTTTFTPPTSAFSSNTYPTTGPRYQDDYSNSLFSNRYIFQSSTTNGITDIGAAPNGSGATGSFTAYNIADINNSDYLQCSINATTSEIRSSYYGIGGALPISIKIGATEILNIASTGITTTLIATTGSIVNTGTFSSGGAKFTADVNGNITKINNVTTSWPGANAVGYLTNNGSGTFSYSAANKLSSRTVAITTTIAATDQVIIFNTNTGALTATLPTAATLSGLLIYILNYTTGTVHNLTITGTVSGVVNPVLSTNGSDIRLFSDGTTFYSL